MSLNDMTLSTIGRTPNHHKATGISGVNHMWILNLPDVCLCEEYIPKRDFRTNTFLRKHVLVLQTWLLPVLQTNAGKIVDNVQYQHAELSSQIVSKLARDDSIPVAMQKTSA